MTIYYTYYSYEEFGRGYIGYRKCPEHLTPETDPYMGSYSDKKFNPTHKIILGTYDNRTDAIADEIVLHKAYDVATNLHFANRAIQTSVGFSIAGTKLSAETRAKLSAANRGRAHSAETRAKMSENNGMKRPEVAAKIAEAKRGKKLSAETRAKMSKALLNSEAHKKASLKRRELPHTLEHNAKVSKALRDKSLRFNWVNELLGVSLENKSVLEILDMYPNLHYSHMCSVTKGRLSQHKGWRVQL